MCAQLLPCTDATFVVMLLPYQILQGSNVVLLVKLDLKVFLNNGDAKGLLAPVQMLLHQQLHTKAPLQRHAAVQKYSEY